MSLRTSFTLCPSTGNKKDINSKKRMNDAVTPWMIIKRGNSDDRNWSMMNSHYDSTPQGRPDHDFLYEDRIKEDRVADNDYKERQGLNQEINTRGLFQHPNVADPIPPSPQQYSSTDKWVVFRARPFEPLVHNRKLPKGGVISPLKVKEYHENSEDEWFDGWSDDSDDSETTTTPSERKQTDSRKRLFFEGVDGSTCTSNKIGSAELSKKKQKRQQEDEHQCTKGSGEAEAPVTSTIIPPWSPPASSSSRASNGRDKTENVVLWASSTFASPRRSLTTFGGSITENHKEKKHVSFVEESPQRPPTSRDVQRRM